MFWNVFVWDISMPDFEIGTAVDCQWSGVRWHFTQIFLFWCLVSFFAPEAGLVIVMEGGDFSTASCFLSLSCQGDIWGRSCAW